MNDAEACHDTSAHVRGPLELTLSQWWCVLRGMQATAERANLALISAGVAFFGLLAAIPAMAALVALVGFFGDPAWVGDQINALYGVVPDEAVIAVHRQVMRLISERSGGLVIGVIVNLVVSLWSALQGVRWVLMALSAVNRRSEKRKAIRRYVAALRFTLIGIGLAVLAVLLMGVLPVALANLRIERGVETLILVLRWPVLGGAAMAFALMLYHWGPRRVPPPWRWLWPGAVLVPVLWLGASSLLTLALRLFPSFGAAYGSLATAVALLIWFYITSLIFLLGGALNAELEFFARGKPAAPVEPGEKIAPPTLPDGGAKPSA
ncbi:MAG TPA: YihY/virulence factor BrkB family protein [Vitreimonas sp.]|uniref:YihY/virulence factor BrkB family protein n=1 Tax=Vitreimonas sp. TaxID=3069702 RepID=UPI002D54743E|nr:YihY/virulence factor BrkB family protein [Vitreimonas sp.]HYD87078.1 YihY/virulence factor BrkB family protein [Vitreimonas sp.]